MTRNPQDPKPTTYSDDAARRILARAAAIDVDQLATLTAADLKAAAREAGISEAALDRAMAELDRVAETLRTEQRSPAKSVFSRWLEHGAGAAIGFATGAVTRAMAVGGFSDPNAETMYGVILLGLMSLAAAVASTGRRAQRRFQLVNLSIWSAFGAGWSIVHGRIFDDIIGLAVMGCVAMAGFGGLLIAQRDKARQAAGASEA